MKVRILVTRRAGVLDPEGRAVMSALRDLGHGSVSDVRTGKLLLLEIEAPDAESARSQAVEMCEKLLANPVIEQYSIEVL
jgi:phosphoribosylformylglycinamidine synthase subunit PurS